MEKIKGVGFILTCLSLLVAMLICKSLTENRELFNRLDRACEAANNEYDTAFEVINETNHEEPSENDAEDFNEISIQDGMIALGYFQENTGVSVGEVVDYNTIFYSIIGIRLDDEQKQMILTIEVFNNSKEVVDVTPFSNMKIYNRSTMEGIAFYSDPSLATDDRLIGLVQPGNRICGEVSFDVPEMIDNKCYLAIINEAGSDEVAFEITTDDIGRTYDAYFDNGEIETP